MGDPASMRAGRLLPAAVVPNIVVTDVFVITIDPYVTGAGCNANSTDVNRPRGRDLNHYFGGHGATNCKAKGQDHSSDLLFHLGESLR